jgi:type VI secretion system (T6SS) phospholipase Tle1-like effector
VSQKIVICCDGTANSFDVIDEESNVAKLYSSLTINADQRGYYHPGVGTMGAPNSRGAIGREWSKIKGLAFGAGLMANIADAYRYLMDMPELLCDAASQDSAVFNQTTAGVATWLVWQIFEIQYMQIIHPCDGGFALFIRVHASDVDIFSAVGKIVRLPDYFDVVPNLKSLESFFILG